MKIAIAQMRVLSANCKENFETIKKNIEHAREQNACLIVFPEMSLPGYFNGDIWEQTSFLKDCEFYNKKISELSKGIDIIFGSIGIDWKKKNEDGRVRKYNAVFHAQNGKLKNNKKAKYPFWIKALMPNYKEFDDSRHFFDLRKLALERDCKEIDLYEPISVKLENKNIKVGVTICEDGWSQDYKFSPFYTFSHYYKHDFFVNLSCSPFEVRKQEKRQSVFYNECKKNNIPIFYVNCVGIQNVGKTIYGFDGSSSFYNPNGEIINLCGFFKEKLSIIDYDYEKKFINNNDQFKRLNSLSHAEEMQISIEYIIKKCLEEWNIKRVVIGASGGIDSALSAVLFSRVLGSENVYLVNMPSKFNSILTINAAQKLAQNLKCPFASIGIEESINQSLDQLQTLHFEAANEQPKITQLVFENIQARDRGGRILAAVAQSLGAVFSCNANKTELTVGYSTLYGDQAGFLCPLADLWKHDVYNLAYFYNTHVFKKEIIPKESIDVVPSAELSLEHNVMENKGDPIIYSYHDYLFRSWIEQWERKTPEDCLIAYVNGTLENLIGCEKDLVRKLFPTAKDFIKDLERWWINFTGMGVFKRMQAPPLVAITSRAYGFDMREQVGRVYFSQAYLALKNKLLA
ncbi:NAD(+) synthase [Fluviispira multicolorata]|uniref:Glutamine-dependent NAD(+) synthetase n=1 Tax=Fluviispira multicolorata TaxID=2654512 RepID=A0A833JDM1_9BACT|nr:NAD(+) synthase [Fluviispira multicolorata]KAB8031844.1 NAD(+) synthase [Fluviispira multicolorata]